jgi:hypothetical protein
VRRLDRDGVQVVDLEGHGARRMPSVLLLEQDGSLLMGSPAEARAPAAPQRVVREFKRRLGDETPIVVGGTTISAAGVAAEMVRWTADTVAAQLGQAPRAVAVTHPAGWGAYRRRVFGRALAEVGLHDVRLLAEPEAALTAHAGAGGLPVGHTLAVYDLGGGTFDAAAVQGVPSPAGLAVLGRSQGLEALGGIDFDEALFWHVCAQLGGAVAALDPTDPVGNRAVSGLRRACMAAKEALSVHPDVAVPVDLPGVRTQVRVTRTQFEDMIAPAVGRTVDVLRGVLGAAGLAYGALDGVLLVGGSSRIPSVARAVVDAVDCPVTVDPDPTTLVARGAALAAAGGMALEYRTGHDAFPAPPGPPGTRPLARVAPVRTPGLLVGPPETSGPLPIAAPGADRTGALLAGTDGRGSAAAFAGVALARSIATARTADEVAPTDSVGLPAPTWSSTPTPRHALLLGEDEDEAVTVVIALPRSTAARRSGWLTTGPDARDERGFRSFSPGLPGRPESLPGAPDDLTPGRRRRMAIAAGVGAALLAGAAVAVAVPMVSPESSPQSLPTALSPSDPVPTVPTAGVLPPDTLAPAASVDETTAPRPEASAHPATPTHAPRRTVAAPPPPRVARPKAVVPGIPVVPAPVARPAPADVPGPAGPATGGPEEQPTPAEGPSPADPGPGTTPDTPGGAETSSEAAAGP